MAYSVGKIGPQPNPTINALTSDTISLVGKMSINRTPVPSTPADITINCSLDRRPRIRPPTPRETVRPIQNSDTAIVPTAAVESVTFVSCVKTQLLNPISAPT